MESLQKWLLVLLCLTGFSAQAAQKMKLVLSPHGGDYVWDSKSQITVNRFPHDPCDAASPCGDVKLRLQFRWCPHEFQDTAFVHGVAENCHPASSWTWYYGPGTSSPGPLDSLSVKLPASMLLAKTGSGYFSVRGAYVYDTSVIPKLAAGPSDWIRFGITKQTVQPNVVGSALKVQFLAPSYWGTVDIKAKTSFALQFQDVGGACGNGKTVQLHWKHIPAPSDADPNVLGGVWGPAIPSAWPTAASCSGKVTTVNVPVDAKTHPGSYAVSLSLANADPTKLPIGTQAHYFKLVRTNPTVDKSPSASVGAAFGSKVPEPLVVPPTTPAGGSTTEDRQFGALPRAPGAVTPAPQSLPHHAPATKPALRTPSTPRAVPAPPDARGAQSRETIPPVQSTAAPNRATDAKVAPGPPRAPAARPAKPAPPPPSRRAAPDPAPPTARSKQAAKAPPATQRFAHPKQGRHRLDWCLYWGRECGAPAAAAWCRGKGFADAQSFTLAQGVGPTFVLGDRKVCTDPACDGFTEIVCVR